MSTDTPVQADPHVLLHGVSWEMYEKILAALDECRTRHTYDRDALQLPSVLYNVTWEDYQKFLDALGDHSLRHSYDRGTLEMLSPRKDHDWIKSLIARMLEAMTLESRTPIQTVGSTTIGGDSIKKGYQPDEAYYIANEPKVRGKSTYDRKIDPPPDLIIEVDVTNSSVARMPGFASLGIPEVWQHTGTELLFHILGSEQQYEVSDHNKAFPFLEPADIEKTLDKRSEMDETTLILEFVSRIREKLQNLS